MKSISPAVKAAVDNGAPRVQLITLELAQATIRLTTCGHELQWQGHTYLSTPLLLGTDKVRSNSEIRIGTRTLSFTAADATMLALLSGHPQVNRWVTQHEAYLDPIGKIIPDPIHMHTWLLTGHKQKGSNVEVSLASEWSLFESTSGRTTTTESQKRFYPDDDIFDFVPNSSNEVLWGE